jgi:hypothetical protein
MARFIAPLLDAFAVDPDGAARALGLALRMFLALWLLRLHAFSAAQDQAVPADAFCTVSIRHQRPIADDLHSLPTSTSPSGHPQPLSGIMTSGVWQESTGTHLPSASVLSCGQTQVLGVAPVTIGGGQTQMRSAFMTCGGGQESHGLGFATVTQALLFAELLST